MAAEPLKFCANLSFLFTEYAFLERFAQAAQSGFAGVEFHFPYAHDKAALAEVQLTSGVEVVLFNLPAGDWDAGERGIACLPGRNREFQDGVGLAIEYAETLGCRRLNCLAGIVGPGLAQEQAMSCLYDNLQYAIKEATKANISLLLEPLNSIDNPGFLLPTSRAVCAVLDALDSDNLKLQYDVYHAQVMEGDLARTLGEQLARIGHIQIADNPGRHEPGSGEINFNFLFNHLQAIGYREWVACEYRPRAASKDSFAWLEAWRTQQEMA